MNVLMDLVVFFVVTVVAWSWLEPFVVRVLGGKCPGCSTPVLHFDRHRRSCKEFQELTTRLVRVVSSNELTVKEMRYLLAALVANSVIEDAENGLRIANAIDAARAGRPWSAFSQEAPEPHPEARP